jgi:hypothetical protein
VLDVDDFCLQWSVACHSGSHGNWLCICVVCEDCNVFALYFSYFIFLCVFPMIDRVDRSLDLWLVSQAESSAFKEVPVIVMSSENERYILN